MTGSSSLDYSRATVFAVCELLETTTDDPIRFTSNELNTRKFLRIPYATCGQYVAGALGALEIMGFVRSKRRHSLSTPEYTAKREDLLRLRALVEATKDGS